MGVFLLWQTVAVAEWTTRGSHQDTPTSANTTVRLVVNLRKYDLKTSALITLWTPVFSQTPDWIQNTADRLKVLHCTYYPPSFIQEMITPSKTGSSMTFKETCVMKVSKIQTRYFRRARIRSVWHGIAWQRKLGYAMKLKHSSDA